MFKIIKETKKAKLLLMGGVEFWVKNAWINKAGELTPAGLRSHEAAAYVPTIAGHEFNAWSPRGGFGRLYFEDRSYIEYSSRSPRGSYESHRACKGERFFSLSASGDIAGTVVENDDVHKFLPYFGG